MDNNSINILLVDDDKALVKGLSALLTKEGFQVQTTYSVEEALKSFGERIPHLMIIDIHLPDKSGNDLIDIIKNEQEDIHIIAISGIKKTTKEATETLERGADDFIEKPFDNKFFLAKIKNISKTIIAEIKLSESEKYYRATFENTGTATVIIDEDTTIRKVNSEFVRLSGFSKKEIEGKKSWADFVHEEDRERMKLYHAQRRIDPQSAPGNYEFRFVDQDKHVKNILLHIAMIPDSKQSIASLIDLTDYIKIQNELSNSEALLNEMGRIAHIGGWEFDLQKKYFKWTDEAINICMLDKNKSINIDIFAGIFLPEYRPVIKKVMNRLIEYGESFSEEMKTVNEQGDPVYIGFIGHANYEQNKIVKIRGTVQDISILKKSEQEVRLYRERLEDLVEDRTKHLKSLLKEMEAFSYSVSHDLRAPLTRLEGFSSALNEDYAEILDDKGKHFIDRIRASARHMAELIDQIQTLAKISKKKIIFQEMNMSELTQNVIDRLKENNPDRKIDFRVLSGMKIKGDHQLLSTLMSHLVSNSIKYTRGIKNARIEIDSKVISGKKTYLVKDNGVGFDMKFYDQLFAPFQKLHDPNHFEGSGIGLAIAQRIINRHGGKIWAESNPHVETIFYFAVE